MRAILKSDIHEIIERSKANLQLLQGKRVLITGAAGFLGTYFFSVFTELNSYFKEISQVPVTVLAVDSFLLNPTEKEITSKSTHTSWLVRDLTKDANFEGTFDYIIHCAGIASPHHYRANPLMTIDVTIKATRELLEKAKSDKSRMLFFSSSEVYGDPSPNNVPTKEEYRGNVSSRGPRACYDESKRLGETLCWVYQNYFDVHVSVVRPFNVYGPGMLPNDFRVLPNFAQAVSNKKSLEVYGTGDQTRTFCYVTDAIVAFLKILIDGKSPDVYNVGNPTPEISMKRLAEIVCEITKHDKGISLISYPSSYPEDEPNRRCPDINKLTSEFNYTPEVNLEEGLKRFFNWTLSNFDIN